MTVPQNRRALLRGFLSDRLTDQAVSLGQVEGMVNARLQGVNDSLSAGVSETIWPGGGRYPYQTAGFQLTIASNNINDTALGTGARTVLVTGLDANWDVAVEAVPMNGTTPVNTVRTDWLRLNLVLVIAAGATSENIGNITFDTTAGAVNLAEIRPLEGRSRNCIGSSSDSGTSTIVSIHASIRTVQNNGRVELGVFTRDNRPAEPFWILQHAFGLRESATTSTQEVLVAPIVVPARGDVELRTLDTTGMNTSITASMEGFQYDNDILNPTP